MASSAAHIGREILRVSRWQKPRLGPLESYTRCHCGQPLPPVRQFSHQAARRQARAATKANATPPSARPAKSGSGPRPTGIPLVAAGGGVLALLFTTLDLSPSNEDTDRDVNPLEPAPVADYAVAIPDELPRYRMTEIRDHGPKSERPWVIYEDKVYDITDWVPAHPGGEVILRAAGGHIEPYWNIFSIHKSQYVRDILEQYVVGRLHPDDIAKGHQQIDDPFVADPQRDASMRQLTDKPFNAETPNQGLADSFLTPNELFYIRNHMWVPVVDDPEDYDISIELPSGDTKIYTIRELKERFKQHAVTAVLQCAGNRRKHMTDTAGKTNGLPWTVGGISCAKWEGVKLRDVLADAGLSMEEPGEDAQHVQFSGAEAYGASIPITSALDPRGDVLLAFRMNDEPLPRDHGFPVRVIVPGHVAARCVKWVKKIVVSDEESNTSWQRRDYKCFGPNETKQDWDKYKSIQKMPITSAITRTRLKSQMASRAIPSSSSNGSETAKTMSSEPHVVQLEGYAYSGGGHEIQRVDISLDGGTTWDQARLLQDDTGLEMGSQAWCWKRWRYEGPLPEGQEASPGKGERKTTFVVKATDDAYNTQPQCHSSIYNLRGNLATAWHKVDFQWEQGGPKVS